MSLLHIDITVDYPGKPGVLRDVVLEIDRGEILGLVGESGSGKSTLAMSVMRLTEARTRGAIVFNGHDLLRLRESDLRAVRGRSIAMVLQSPITSLNPVLRIGTQMAEAWRAHDRKNPSAWRTRALEAFEMVALPGGAELFDRYPRQLSVGQAQRVLIAMAILHRPQLLIADEPTSALDAITSAEVIGLFKRLNQELNMAILFISHDLLSVISLCDRLAILKDGEIVESGVTAQVFRRPEHGYTRALLGSLPQPPLHEVAHDLIALSGFGQTVIDSEPEASLVTRK